MTQRTGIYPGTFDPITKGHVDVITQALRVVDRLVIAVADDVMKTPIFSMKERAAMVKGDVTGLKDAKRITVLPFKGLLVDFAVKQESSIIIRGLRAISDFEYELQLAATNARLNPSLQTVFLPAGERMQFIASRMVKEVARLGGELSPFVSDAVAEKLRAYFKR